MKKTIAKMMAAAMMLSAVPAVTLPSFVSKAADKIAATNTTTSTFYSQFAGGETTVKSAADGEIFSFYLPGRDDNNANNRMATRVIVPSDEYDIVPVAAGLSADLVQYIKINKVVVGANNLAHAKGTLDVTKMTTAQKTSFVNAVKAGTNTYKVQITRKNVTCGGLRPGAGAFGIINGTTYVKGSANYRNAVNALVAEGIATGTDKFTVESENIYSIGGTYDGGKIKTGIADEDRLLMDGNVYATIDKVTNDDLAELELLKQDKNEGNKLEKNDQLRGKLLKLNTVQVEGVTYKVGKLGAQALKKAKMKKIQLKNCSKVGKGAMRECKQLRNVNLKDKNKVRKIHAKAFYKCKNLRNIIIDARKLNTVGKDSFMNVKKNCKVKLKASKSKYNEVVKKIKKANKKNTTLKYSRIAP